MQLRKLPIPFWKIFSTGLCLGLVLVLRSYIPYAYWQETDLFVWEKFVWPPILNYTIWPFFVPILYHFMVKYPLFGKSSFQKRGIAILIWIGISLSHEISTYVIWYVGKYLYDGYIITSESLTYLKAAIPSATVTRMIEYLVIYGLFLALDYYNEVRSKELELAQVESELNEARLTALKRQLQPHFLFNTLNSISSLMEVDVKKSQGMVAKLGDLLRSILDQNKHLVTVEKELEFIKNYLDIEEIRFKDRLKVVYEIDPQALNRYIPFLITQPLVENAIKHGLAKKGEEGLLKIIIRNSGTSLNIRIQDNGVGVKGGIQNLTEGIGINNVSRRLKRHYLNEAKLTLSEINPEGILAEITIENAG